MPEVESECVFETTSDQVELTTKTNGDSVFIRNLHLTQGQATSMAWLINADDTAKLEFTVKVKE